MTPIRLLIFLYALFYLHFKNEGGIADGRSYSFRTRVEKGKQRELVRKMVGKGDWRLAKEQGHDHIFPSIVDSFDDFYQENNGDLNVKYQLIDKIDKNHARYLLDVKSSSFVSFNADYFVPKPHPPKNNGGQE